MKAEDEDPSMEVLRVQMIFDRKDSMIEIEGCHTGMWRRWFGCNNRVVGPSKWASRILYRRGPWCRRGKLRRCNKIQQPFLGLQYV
jgi:hypothetical protein